MRDCFASERGRRSTVRRTGIRFLTAAALVVGCSDGSKEPDSKQALPDRQLARLEPAKETPHIVPEVPKNVLDSRLAGQWYDADPDRLRSELAGYVKNVSGEALDDVVALILPHAGYQYSGQVAAHGIKQIVDKPYRRVVVLGPSHSQPMRNVASVPDATHYATPLGETPLDLEFIAALKQSSLFTTIPEAHLPGYRSPLGEHSVQIEVPLLQFALDDFLLVPIVVGQLDAATARAMGDELGHLIDEQTLVVASSDFTHYGASFSYVPFRDDVPENLEKLDMGAWEMIEQKDLDGFADYVTETGATICGRCPIMVLLGMLPAESKAHLLAYDTSGRMTSSYESSVSYVSIAFTGQWPKGGPAVMTATIADPLSDADKQQLLKLARATVAYYLDNGDAPQPKQAGIEVTPAMEEVMGAFVTLHKRGRLRGCIGEVIPRRPIWETVIDQAVNAAFRDPRFPPVQADELLDLHFEISAYADAPRPVSSYEDIVLGQHGMVLEKGARRALFLPQVAPEQGWDIDETLTHLAQKAGLPSDGWKEGCRFSVFEAIVFSEEKQAEG